MTFQQFLLILWARRKLALYTLGATILTTLVISLLVPKQYTASTSVVIDVKSPDPIAGVILPGLVAPGYMATQMDIIQSERVANRVVKLLGLDTNPTAIEQWKEATDGQGSIEAFYVDALQKKLDIKPSRDSNVINIAFSGENPEFAAAVSNAFARAYIDTTIELRVEPARQYAAWFDERQKGLRAQLERAQSRLSSYQQDKGIVATDDRLDSEAARLNELNAQLAAAQAQRAEAAGRQKSGSGETSPEVLQNALIQSIKADLARSEAKLSEVSNNLGKNHPQVQQLEAQIASTQQQLREEITRISGGAASANRQIAQKEEELKAAIEAQKKRVLELKSERDELSVLVKDVENAQHAYEAVSARVNQTSLESQSQQTNVLVLSPATIPAKPSRPKVFLNLLVSIFLGSMLGVGAALASEIFDRRVRDAADLGALEGIPVLGVLAAEVRRQSMAERFFLSLPFLRRRALPAPAEGA